MPEATVTVTRLGGLGDGIAELPGGTPLILAKTAPGDVLRARIHSRARGQAFGDLVELLAPGPSRVAAPCMHFSVCGGCALQHIAENDYRAFKRKRVGDALRQAGFPGIEPTWHFLPATRRRTEFTILREGGNLRLAYFTARSHNRFAVAECLILAPELQALISPLTAWLQTLTDLPALPAALQLTLADNGTDAVFESDAPHAALATLCDIPGILRVSVKNGNATAVLRQNAAPVLRLGGIDVPLPPGAFLQATRESQALLTAAALRATAEAARVADLFCGIGSYALPLAQTGRTVTAVEWEAAMLAPLQTFATAHALPLTTERRNLFTQPLSAEELNRFDAVILNPPRAGAREQCEQLAKSAVPRIALISCNPATFARDARLLQSGGYRLEQAEAIDQFVWSAHVEMAGVFGR